MGLGDEILGSGMARGAAKNGYRVAFGNGRQIIWHPNAFEIFRHNPNVAPPGSEREGNLKWIEHYSGKRAYHGRPPHKNRKWNFNYDFRPTPGEIFFDDDELEFAELTEPGFVLIEPRTKPNAINKQWGADKWAELTKRLQRRGVEVAQFAYAPVPRGVRPIEAPTFRYALAALRRARAVVLPEGGTHHGAAAVGVGGVVIFGGFTPPELTGYDVHTNIFTGGEACGNMNPCTHCRRAMGEITVERVLTDLGRHL